MVHRDASTVLDNHHDTTAHHGESEKRTRWVVLLTAVMMIVELVYGYATHSMALTADGWHMATHVGALGLSVLAYWFARTRAGHEAFTFGTGKVYALAGYTSAAGLGVVAVFMTVESIARFVSPEVIDFKDALPVAVIGLLINLVSALLLGHGHTHGSESAHPHDHEHTHDHDHAHDHAHEHQPAPHGEDTNLKSAYLHVVADALTSVLAIGALLAGQFFGWAWLDPAMGLVGAALISRWSWDLVKQTGAQLLDASPSPETQARIQKTLEAVDDVRVADLHLWTMGPGRLGCIVAIVTSNPRDACEYRALLGKERLAHLTVEVHSLTLAPSEPHPSPA